MEKLLITLKEIEGGLSPHSEYVDRELTRRKVALEFLNDVDELAKYLGAKIENLNMGEDWALAKDIFPGVTIHFVYTSSDEEFSSEFKVFYSGENVKKLNGEDLSALTIACANHILRYIKETLSSKDLPAICDIV
jgi:hypothetical protein